MKYICELCGMIYDEEKGLPEKGIAPGTEFAQLPEWFECPGCYGERHAFYPQKDNHTFAVHHGKEHTAAQGAAFARATGFDSKDESDK